MVGARESTYLAFIKRSVGFKLLSVARESRQPNSLFAIRRASTRRHQRDLETCANELYEEHMWNGSNGQSQWNTASLRRGLSRGGVATVAPHPGRRRTRAAAAGAADSLLYL